MKTKIESFTLFVPLLFCFLLSLSIATSTAQAQKTVITKADDLPRRSVTLKGKATEIVEDMTQLRALTIQLTKNLENDLEQYDIQDKATLKAYYSTLMACYFFLEEYAHTLTFIPKIQELSDKNAEKLTTGIFLKAYTHAKLQHTNEQTEAFKKVFSEEYAKIWQALPYEEVKEEVNSMRASLSIFNPALVTSSLDSQIQPFLDNNKNVVPEGIITNFVGIRLTLDKRAALIPDMLKILDALYEQNKTAVSKNNIWEEREVALSKEEKATEVIVAIWDSGTDVSVFPQDRLYTDKKGRNGVGYSLINFKNDGLLLENPEGKIKTDVKRLQLLTKGFMDLQSAIESPEVAEIRKAIASLKPEEAKDFQEELGFYGNYSHGTHVAGIALRDNPFAKLLVARMGFEYRTLPPAHTLENAKFQAKMYTEVVKYFKENKVRIVNMSWRYNAQAYEGMLALNGIGKNEQERKKMAREMFEIEKKALYEAFKSAPEILFICGSGNENNDADFAEYIPASFEGLPNLITIGAVDSEGKKTSFTTQGKTVRFYANGFEVESYVPDGDKIKFSGTSMASPNVANLASKILALKPELKPSEVIQWIEKGSDTLPEDPNLKLINPKKTLELLTGREFKTGLGKLLIRKWKPSAESIPLMVEDVIEGLRKEDEAQAAVLELQKDLVAQLLAEVVLEYKTGGNYQVTIPGNPTQIGTWEIDAQNKQIIKKIEGETRKEEIIQLDDSSLIIINPEGRKYGYEPVN